MGNLLDLFVFKYNRTDFHELNLDWLISDVRTLAETLKNFVSLNSIKFADPLQWNIAKQYEAITVVVDPGTGTAYLSSQPVPSGVPLSNTDYWTPIFNLNIATANNNITLRDDGNNILSTFTSDAGDWLLWNGTLYRVSQAIALNEAYVIGYNLDRYTVEMFINDYINAVKAIIGDLDDLNTTDKDNVVAAINEVLNDISSNKKIFKDIAEMTAADYLNIGDVVITAYPYPARWEIIAQQTQDLVNKDLANNLTAHLLNSAPINIGALKTLADYENISDIIDFLITNDYKQIIVPNGIYKLHVTIPAGFTLSGLGRTTTSFIPVEDETSIITVNGNEITLSDFQIVDNLNHAANGITVGSNGCNNSHFKNLHVENCNYGFISFYSLIWDEFINCDFIGNFFSGFVVQGSMGAFFNNNLIESCKFNNNVNNGLYIDCQTDKCFANTFNSSNVEYNAIDRFGETSTADCAVYITGANIFNGCYFEGNNQSATGAVIKGVGTQIFNGCSFINEKYLVNNSLFASVNSTFTFIGCHRYNEINGIATQAVNDGRIIVIGCNFTIANTGTNNLLSLINNKLTNHTASNGVIDGAFQVNRIRSNITSTTNILNGQVLYLVNDLAADYTIDSTLMADGQTYTLTRRSGVAMFVNWTGSAHVLMPIH